MQWTRQLCIRCNTIWHGHLHGYKPLHPSPTYHKIWVKKVLYHLKKCYAIVMSFCKPTPLTQVTLQNDNFPLFTLYNSELACPLDSEENTSNESRHGHLSCALNFDRNWAHQVQLGFNAIVVQRSCDDRPNFLKVLLWANRRIFESAQTTRNVACGVGTEPQSIGLDPVFDVHRWAIMLAAGGVQ